MSVWDRYKTAEESTICMVGVIALCVSLCKIDGKFSDDEMLEILRLIPHTEEERDFVLDLINEIDENNLEYDFHAKNIKKYLSNQKDFLDFILATMYKLAWADHVMDDGELNMIQNTQEIFYSEVNS
tara:strand:+ start:2857 stop:3237 length:381 start_codon:yes stop_codon:yes gene_type:complete